MNVINSAESATHRDEKFPRSAGIIDSSGSIANAYLSENTHPLNDDGSSISSEPSQIRALVPNSCQRTLHINDQRASGQHGFMGLNVTEYSSICPNQHNSGSNSLPLDGHQKTVISGPEKSGLLITRLATVHERTIKVSSHQKSRYQLELWVYETCHSKISLAERLEKSNWEVDRLEKL